MTNLTNWFSGIGVTIALEVTGRNDSQRVYYCSTLVHENTAIASGIETGNLLPSYC